MRLPGRSILLLVVFSFSSTQLTPDATADQRPNIVWISCEDISSHLGCYGDSVATTPNLDKLASEGVRYSHAFTCHGVCAPSRTGIITAQYPITIGANHMRSKVKLPKHMRCFPEYLRQAGYYCTNNSKTDYNFEWERDVVWDESSKAAHWKNRPNEEQPFFAVFNFTMCHESRIWPDNWKQVTRDLSGDLFHDPEKVVVPELYPDTLAVRAAIARLHDIITVMDQAAGRVLMELDEAGIAENTIVIFWSDHGNGFARAKRWIYDTGTRVPMIVRIPEQFRVNGQGDPGSVDDHLINLIDLGPTVLNLAGVAQPSYFQGQPFLGHNLPEPRKYIFGARDRIDDRFDMVRSVRDRHFRYVRNLMPWLPALQYVQYAERSITRQELRRAAAEDTLSVQQRGLFETPRPQDELYNLEADPYELNNLAEDPQYADRLAQLQNECDHWQRDVRDAHIVPESILITEEQSLSSRWNIFHGAHGEERWGRVFAAVMNRASLKERSQSDDAGERWWNLAHMADSNLSKSDEANLLNGLSDESPAVMIMAARLMYQRKLHRRAAVATLRDLLHHKIPAVQHAAILTVDEVEGLADELRGEVSQVDPLDKYVKRVAEHILNGSVQP